MKHVIIFGGTGMLANASKWLIENTDRISIVGRNRHKLNQLRSERDHSDLHLVTLDYKNSEDLTRFLRKTIQRYGPVDLVVSWIHSVAPNAIPVIFNEINHHQESHWRFIHIKGSSHDLSTIKTEITVPENCLYRAVLLGFKNEDGVSRWLTHEEISNGVISAIYYDRKKTIVGMLNPWKERP
jgi:hypothetical protein